MTPPLRRPAPNQSRFTYTPRDKTALTQRGQQYASRGRDVWLNSTASVYTPKKGENWIRILPPAWEHARHYGFDVYLHYGIGPDFTAFACPARMNNQPCPICDERQRLSALGQEEPANELRATFRLMTYIVDRKEPDKGAQIWMMPMTIDRELIALCQDSRTGEVLWLDDPENGYDIEFTRTGEGITTKYTGIRIARSPSPVNDPGALDYIAAHPLPECVVMTDAATMAKTLEGTKFGEERNASRNPAQPAATAPAPISKPVTTPPAPPAARQPVPSRTHRSAPATAPAAAPVQSAARAEAQWNAAMDALALYDLGIPDTVADADLPRAVAQALGDAISEFPDLAGLA